MPTNTPKTASKSASTDASPDPSRDASPDLSTVASPDTPPRPTPHPLDLALALHPASTDPAQAGRYTGRTSADYWNMVGPFGGITAGLALQAVMQHPQRLGEPIALTVNFAGAMAAGDFEVEAVPVRTNRSTQHWTVTLTHRDADGQRLVSTTATAVTALRRPTWGAQEAVMPAAPAPASLARGRRPRRGVAWLDQFDQRPIVGEVPDRWDGQGGADSLSLLWLRDHPPRPLDYPALAGLSDLFFPRIWLRRACFVPLGTVSMAVYFHADAAQLAATGRGYLLGQARGQGFGGGFFDHSGQLWNEAGVLLATTHQIVYYKE